jgi:hypothetical protein
MKESLAQLMEANLTRVWSERDPLKRMKAIAEIYEEAASLYHVDDKTDGLEAINDSVTALLRHTPGEYIFSKLQPVIINNNVGKLVWGIGTKDRPPVATGMDIAFFENDKIKSLYVFLD